MVGNILKIITAFIVILGAALGAINYFAKANDLELVDMRLEQKIIGDSIYNLYEQKRQLEITYGNDNCSTWRGPTSDRDAKRYQRIKLQLKALETKQDAIIQQQTKKQ